MRPFSSQQFVDSLVAASHFIPQTLLLIAVPFVVSIAIGFVVAVIRVWRIPVLAPVLQVLTTIIRGIPVYLLLVIANLLYDLYFDTIAEHFGWAARKSGAGLLNLSIVILSIAFIPAAAEFLRGAMLAVPASQYEAGYASGLTRLQILRRIVIPQMIPEAIPSISNMLISLIKASALTSAIGVMDILNESIRSASYNYNLLEAYLAAALLYWGLAVGIELLMKAAELRAGRFKKALAA
ncbi:ABC transporter permease subunit [Bifidobacterium stellenboschense]|uniref:Amino acid ABC transporter permease n=1 Tax=Bifidobacterium stellenboschense TaxID=762211 RepID=A0A087DNE2_9BIFI|nr:ABC transporter permease subunit [Bifidobacterium stellenboschense]KFI97042.1 amino acid ABC transporter permease [Bifidobacterium stellenboschense]